MARLLIVSNRLPVTVHVDQGALSVTRSVGGLATALRGAHERLDALWIGWPGDVSRLAAPQRHSLDEQLDALRVVPVYLTPDEVEGHYDGFSNGVLWPLFHYLLDKVNLDAREDWEAYRAVNERFAAIVAERWRPGDMIWIHDYQLMLLPELLRRRLPTAKIGFFLHVPFPSAEVFRILPWRAQILRGLLGADLLGFHTTAYRRNFVQAAARVLGLDPDEEVLDHEGRRVDLGIHPIGVDVTDFERLAADPKVQAEAQRIRAEAQGRRIVLGIDRLDYTKGIPRRLLAIERLLESEPELQRGVRFLQLAVPSREKTQAYAEFRRVVHEMVGRINGRYASVGAVPIHYLDRALEMERVAALYLAADVMLVTPLRDGMNLVAKEYVATRLGHTGALVLSEFAGAAAELSEALLVNPYDIDSVASAVKQALAMPASEQRIRMTALRARVVRQDVHRWAESFILDLACAGGTEIAAAAAAAEAPVAPEGSGRALPDAAIARLQRAPFRALILDYDGTLVPLAATPELAAPDDDLRALLATLAAEPNTALHLVSGRPRDDLERWFGALPVGLHAEHGFWSRDLGGAWTPLDPAAAAWKASLRPLIEATARRTAGSFVEEKTSTLAWHYRAADPELAAHRARELRAVIAGLVIEHDLELLAGAKVLEIRPRGVNKGRVLPRVIAGLPADAAILAIGDDRTDEDLFAALPPTAIAIHVGSGPSRAAYRLPDPAAARQLLRSLVAR